MALPWEPGNNKERCTLCIVALAKKRCAMPRDRDCHSKLPPALPCSHSQPSSPTRVRVREREERGERESARREHRAEPAQKSNYLSSSHAGPHRPRPRKIPNLAAGFSPERPPLLRAELPIPRPAASLHAAAVRCPSTRFELCWRGGGRPSRGQGALVARGLVTSRYQIILPFAPRILACLLLGLAICLVHALVARGAESLHLSALFVDSVLRFILLVLCSSSGRSVRPTSRSASGEDWSPGLAFPRSGWVVSPGTRRCEIKWDAVWSPN